MEPYLLKIRIAGYETDELVRLFTSDELTPEAKGIVREELEKRGAVAEHLANHAPIRLKSSVDDAELYRWELLAHERAMVKWRRVSLVICFLTGIGTLIPVLHQTTRENIGELWWVILSIMYVGGYVIAFAGVATRNLIGPVTLLTMHVASVLFSIVASGSPQFSLFMVIAFYTDFKTLGSFNAYTRALRKEELRRQSVAVLDPDSEELPEEDFPAGAEA